MHNKLGDFSNRNGKSLLLEFLSARCPPHPPQEMLLWSESGSWFQLPVLSMLPELAQCAWKWEMCCLNSRGKKSKIKVSAGVIVFQGWEGCSVPRLSPGFWWFAGSLWHFLVCRRSHLCGDGTHISRLWPWWLYKSVYIQRYIQVQNW